MYTVSCPNCCWLSFDDYITVCCYFQDFREEHYVGPRLAVETVCQFVASHERSEMTVVDVAAGTGLVGLEVTITNMFFVLCDSIHLSNFFILPSYLTMDLEWSMQ